MKNREIVVDNFAGGGGASTGIEIAIGRSVDIAINHDPNAIAMHTTNHPDTLHYCESVFDIDPIAATAGRPVGLAWFSPDCRHFSKAKGSKPVQREIRGLAWIVLRWALAVRPRVMMLENVEEFKTWGPLITDADGSQRPDPARAGETFEAFCSMLGAGVPAEHPALAECCEFLGVTLDSEPAQRLVSGLGYAVDHRELRADNYGTPQRRKRFFMVIRCDGQPIVWPTPTHGDPKSSEVQRGQLKPWRTAADCVDWSIPASSIFERKKPLADNTLRRVAKGLWRHVLTNAEPFIVTNTTGHPGAGIDDPLPTVTTGGHHMLGQAVLAPFTAGAGGPKYSGKPVAIDRPFGTITADNHRALVSPVLTPFLTEHANASNQRNMPVSEPMRTLCAQVKGGHFSVVAPTMIPLRGTSEAQLFGHSVERPLSTVTASGAHHAIAAVHLAHLTHHGDRAGTSPDEPLPTVTAAHRGEQAMITASLVDMGHGESCSTGARRWSVGVRSLETPLNTVTASASPSALTMALFEQANGGFYDGDGNAADVPMSTLTASGSNQRLVTAYAVKYYGTGDRGQSADEPMHTITTKDRIGVVSVVKVPADCLSPELREKARRCAELLHKFLPEHFGELAEMVLMVYRGTWYVLVDITLRMLQPPELYAAQGFPDWYVIDMDYRGVRHTKTAQVARCGNAVPPQFSEALVRANLPEMCTEHREAAA
ncbi:DNA cytosine methyltransferase [Dickeya fangzhongdai]|uniref:DNA cytosine methyltransferase n=1 Tax=Dickeya fangzhongdai TaxID=1778540 RepID=UPI001ADC8908|nr:DNA cytosine methyltransferase [Dickeya fangzhongdai]MBO8132478.1 DNA cytosine methyltransferase [Dickeya fangzhongdai]